MDTIKANQVVEYTLGSLNQKLGELLGGDVIAIRSPIYRGLDDMIRIQVENLVQRQKASKKKKASKKLIVMLETDGGYVDVVERINNVFRKHFREVVFVVPGYAYSAGTVLVLSGDSIYMDYYSVLGPIDPQIQDVNGRFIPGMAYLYKYDELIKKSQDGSITQAELLFLTKRFDPAEMFVIEQAKHHSQDLIEEWLPKYKFKNWKVTKTKKIKVTPKMKRQRAAKIAEILGDAAKWHSHGRGITMRELTGRDIKLLIEDFGRDANLNLAIRQYYDLFDDYTVKVRAKYAIHTMDGLVGI